KNSATPTAVPASGGADAILRTAPTATGIVTANITATNRSSRGGYVWDEFVTAWNAYRSGSRRHLSAVAPGTGGCGYCHLVWAPLAIAKAAMAPRTRATRVAR